MPNLTDKFLLHRGVRAAPLKPGERLDGHEKHWSRTVRWKAAAERAIDLVRTHGEQASLEFLNLAVGLPLFSRDIRHIPQLGRAGGYGFILLPGGCNWALQEGGGCTFCEFQKAVDEVVGSLAIRHSEFIDLFQTGFAAMQDADIVNVFTAGSFLNPGEIPPETQLAIAQAVAASSVSILRVESRVQYMRPEFIEPLVAALGPGQTLDIAIGFETLNDHIRNVVLNKGMGRTGFMHAVKIAKAAGARVSAYVMLMPTEEIPEGEAIRECCASIRFAFETGVDEVLLQARYSERGGVPCPQLWSILHVLNETAAFGPVMLGKWENELPPPQSWPRNCPKCTPAAMKLLGAWRMGLDPKTIGEDLWPACACRSPWAAEIARPGRSVRVHLPQTT